MNKYNLVTTYDRIYNNIELVIKFDCKDKWIFKDEDGQYIIMSTEDIEYLEPRKKATNKIDIGTITELIDSEIKQMEDECESIEEILRLSHIHIDYNDWFRANGALEELKKLKMKINDAYSNEKRKGD